jgi:uncharacterized protein (UPF0128 family)
MTDASAFYLDEAAVEEVVRGFESCELPPAEFDHRAHLAVALCYLLRSTDEEARERIRAGIARYVRAHGINPRLYHETLTVFWLRRVRAFVERASMVGRTRVEMANGLAVECGGSRLVFDYYSKELIDSERARQEWTQPDLKALDF